MKRWIHAATEHEDFVVDSDLSSYLDQKEAKRQKSHEKYIARRNAIRRAAARAFEAEEDTPKNQQEAKGLYNKYKDGAVTASTDTKSRIAQLEELVEWLKNDISSLNEMLADPNIPRYNDESDEDLEDRIADRQQELADAEEQLNFAWQDDEAEYNYALEQQEFNPDGSLALYGTTINGSSDDRGHFDINDVKAYLKENLNGKIDSIITFTDGGFFDLEKEGISGVGVWVGYRHKGSASSKASERILKNSMYAVEDAFSEYLEQKGIDPDSIEIDDYLSSSDMFRIWAPYDSTTANASANHE